MCFSEPRRQALVGLATILRQNNANISEPRGTQYPIGI